MLQDIRNNMQGTMAKVIIGIIIVPFAAFGIESLLSGGGAQDVAEVNGEEITEIQLQRAIRLQRRQMASRMGENIDESLLEDSKLREPALDGLIDRELLLQKADDASMVIADRTLDSYIVQIEDFHADGKFSPGLYETLLRSSGMTPQYYKSLVESELLIKQLASAYIDGGFITPRQIELINKFSHQKRDIRYLTIAMAGLKSNITVSDEELQSYYDTNSARYFSTEEVAIKYLEIKKSDYFPDIDEADIKAQYDQEAADYDIKTDRRVSHILVKVGEDTNTEQAKTKLIELKLSLEGGADFVEMAKQHSDDLGTKNNGGDLGYSSGDVFPETIESAISELVKGQLSEPVVTDAGVHLLKLVDLQETLPPTYEERRSQILIDLQNTGAESEYIEQVERLADISFNAEDLSEPAEELGLTVKQTGYFSRSGGEGLLAERKVLKSAFSKEVLTEASNSELIEISSEHAVVIHLLEHKEPKLKPLQTVKASIQKVIKDNKARELIAKQGDEIIELVQQGASIESVANTKQLQWQAKPASERTGGGIARQIVNRAFELPVPGKKQRAIDKISLPNGDMVILAVSNVKDGVDEDMAEAEAKGMANYLGRLEGQEVFELEQKANKKLANISIY